MTGASAPARPGDFVCVERGGGKSHFLYETPIGRLHVYLSVYRTLVESIYVTSGRDLTVRHDGADYEVSIQVGQKGGRWSDVSNFFAYRQPSRKEAPSRVYAALRPTLLTLAARVSDDQRAAFRTLRETAIREGLDVSAKEIEERDRKRARVIERRTALERELILLVSAERAGGSTGPARDLDVRPIGQLTLLPE